jgi:predicted TIM-barrel fold metal-dependent hydrolase
MANKAPVNPKPEVVAGEQWISGDSHMAEPPDLWEKRLPKSMRDRAIKFPDKLYETGFHLRAGGWDPHERLKDMAYDGVSAEVLYPTRATQAWMLTDAELEEASIRVYNDWMIEFCSVCPERFWGLAMVPVHNISAAVKEMERCRKAGLVGVIPWTCPPPELPWTSDHYERFWAAAADLDMTVSMHANNGPFTGNRRGAYVTPWDQAGRYDVMRPLGDIIASGALERYPNLKVVMAEYGVGWMPFWSQELDYYYTARLASIKDPLPRPPSEYIWDRKQVYGTFISDKVGGSLLPQYGLDNFIWTSDYPHLACIWPESQIYIAQDLGHLTKDDRAKVTNLTSAKLYNNGKLPPKADPKPKEGGMQSLEKWIAPTKRGVVGESPAPNAANRTNVGNAL